MAANKQSRRKRYKANRQTTPTSESIPSRVAKQRHARKTALRAEQDDQEVNRPHSPTRILRHWNDEILEAGFVAARGSVVKNNVDCKLELRRADELSRADMDACYKIVRHTSIADYTSSSGGWSGANKRREMADADMLYMLIRAGSGVNETFAPGTVDTDILGFASFKIDNDDPPHEQSTIIYIYEVHIGEKFRGKGWGKFLVNMVEIMAHMAGIHKTMLTVYTSNEIAVAAYKRLRYEKDEGSPPDREVRGRVIKADYMIMSRQWDPNLRLF